MNTPLWTADAIWLYHQVLGGAGPKAAARVLARSREICRARGKEPVAWGDVQDAYDEERGR